MEPSAAAAARPRRRWAASIVVPTLLGLAGHQLLRLHLEADGHAADLAFLHKDKSRFQMLRDEAKALNEAELLKKAQRLLEADNRLLPDFSQAGYYVQEFQADVGRQWRQFRRDLRRNPGGALSLGLKAGALVGSVAAAGLVVTQVTSSSNSTVASNSTAKKGAAAKGGAAKRAEARREAEARKGAEAKKKADAKEAAEAKKADAKKAGAEKAAEAKKAAKAKKETDAKEAKEAKKEAKEASKAAAKKAKVKKVEDAAPRGGKEPAAEAARSGKAAPELAPRASSGSAWPLELDGPLRGIFSGASAAVVLLAFVALLRAVLRRRRRRAGAAAAAARTPVGWSPRGQEYIQFPPGFQWGSAMAAYQIEGGAREGGRGPSIWDDFSRAGKCYGRQNGDVACNHYRHWKEDVALMKSLGMKAYRLSLSWSRILPQGAECAPNEEGIMWYRDLLEELLDAGITPMVTLYHWDLPSALEAKGGWLNPKSVQWFETYARLCFARFGDLVCRWCTINEPSMQAMLGYGLGCHAPGRRSRPGEDPYIVVHHLLLAHATAYRAYKKDFSGAATIARGVKVYHDGNGEVGIAINTEWYFPADYDNEDQLEQCERAIDFTLGWIAEPLRTGDYPPIMRKVVKERLPQFSKAETDMVMGSYDWIGINHYTSREFGGSFGGLRGLLNNLWVLHKSDSGITGSLRTLAELTFSKHHFLRDFGQCPTLKPEWEFTEMGWPIVPEGMEATLRHVSALYQPRCGVYVTENGVAFEDDTVAEAMSDGHREEFLKRYLVAIGRAIQGGADVRGYYYWTFMDNFEWAHGTSKRFGLVHVDFKDPKRTRRPKPVAAFFKQVAAQNAVTA